MKKTMIAVALCSASAGCSAGSDGGLGEHQLVGVVGTAKEKLDVTSTKSLIKKQGNLDTVNDESARQTETQSYYNTVHTGQSGGSSGPTISAASGGLGTLQNFRDRYGFSATETVTYYYNKGDLGIGREMHCVDGSGFASKETACYVRNFATDLASDQEKSEFRFGLSSNIAFANMAANKAFATVAMVFRGLASDPNKIFFVVYGPDANATPPAFGATIANAAALDRSGVLNDTAFRATGHPLGTPGGTYNNNIPSNCLTCHGGAPYDNSGHGQSGALFLPFDLDQFEYQTTSGKTRQDQLESFKTLNEIVWKVDNAAGGSSAGASVVAQLNTWYGGPAPFAGNFNGANVISGWSTSPATATDTAFYSSTLRFACRNCHMALPGITFDTAAQFKSNIAPSGGNGVVDDLCGYLMPQSLQALRLFWQSQKPAAVEAYIRGLGFTPQANQLHACGPGNVATLDPQLIAAITPG